MIIYTHGFLRYVITHPYSNFNGNLTKLPLTLVMAE